MFIVSVVIIIAASTKLTRWEGAAGWLGTNDAHLNLEGA
jgi:hypothetical protein